ncbi:MAG: cytochrome c biogenesis protein ResB [Thermoflexales bacterium]
MTVWADPADPIEDRDPWRALWRLLTHDALLIALCAVVAAGLIATVILPQQPSAGVSDPVAYSRWEAEAKQREGALYALLNGLGLNNVAQATWWRMALAALMPIAGLRLADRLVRLAEVWRGGRDGELRDERRARVTLNAPPLADLADRLRARRYRVLRHSDDVLVADRAPWAELASAALHLGLVFAAVGLSLNLVAGWEATNKMAVAGASTLLRDGYAITLDDAAVDSASVTIVLQPNDAAVTLQEGGQARVAGLNLALNRIVPGYRLSATSSEAKPLLIRASNFVSPTTELLVTLGAEEPERYIAVPEAQLALALTASDSAGQPVRLRAFVIPSGEVITDTTVQPTLVIGDAEFRFKPAQGAMIDVRYAPGDLLWQLGLAATLVGMIGSLIYPMQRLLICRRGEWTEFYAGGRYSRHEAARLAESRREASPS